MISLYLINKYHLKDIYELIDYFFESDSESNNLKELEYNYKDKNFSKKTSNEYVKFGSIFPFIFNKKLKEIKDIKNYENCKKKYSQEDLYFALKESLKFQSHYAELLNSYDSGKRLSFNSVEDWIKKCLN